MEGIASNLRSRVECFCKKNQFNKVKKRNNSQITQVIKLLSTEYFLKEELPKNTSSFMKLWKPIIMPLIIENLIEIKKELNHQENFSKESLELIKKIRKFCEKKNNFEKQKKNIKKKKNNKENKEKEIEEINNSFFFDKEFNDKNKYLNEKIEEKIDKKKNF